MKKLISLLLATIMLTCTFTVSALESTVSYRSKTVMSATPVIDGIIDEVYRQSFSATISSPSTFGIDIESVANVYALYDNKYVYVAAHITDTTPFTIDKNYLESDPHPYLNDAFEIRIATNGHMAAYNGTFDNHHLFYVDSQGRRFSSYEQQVLGFKGKTTYTKGKEYVVEVAIPLTSPLVEGEDISFNFQVDNMTGDPAAPKIGCIGLSPIGKILIPFKVGGKASGEIADNTQVEEQPQDLGGIFKDVTTDDWFFDDVVSAYQRGLMKGTSSYYFSPDVDVTRAMFAAIMHRLAGEPVVNYAMPFTDFSQDEWYAEAVRWASSEKIINGVDDTHFAPDESITREQMAAMIYRYAKIKGQTPTGAWAQSLPFTDVDTISNWARESIMYCYGEGFMSGNQDKTFAPNNNATRAEVATVIVRVMNELK